MKGKYDTKFRVEDCWTFNIRELSDSGLFYENIGGITEILNPPKDREVRIIHVWARTAIDCQKRYSVDITFPAYNGNIPEADEFDYTISTFPVKCSRGGERLYLVCPMKMENGNTCNEIVKILYLPPGQVMLGCRKCHQLTYNSTRKPKTSAPSRFVNPGANWVLELNSEFQSLKKQYGIDNSEFSDIQVPTGSVNSPRVFQSESEKLNYAFARMIGMSDKEYDKLDRKAEKHTQRMEKEWEDLDKNISQKE